MKVSRHERRHPELKRVTKADRREIEYAVSRNRRWRAWEEARRDAKVGPHICKHCGAEPCGMLWPMAACCHRCTHLPMPHWKLTHVLWYRRKPFYVMEVEVRRPGAPTPEEAAAVAEGATVEETEEEIKGEMPRRQLSSVSDAVYYRWDGTVQWIRRARTHYFLGLRATPIEFLRMLPNEQEIEEHRVLSRPHHPFEEGIAERPEDEVGEPFRDRRRDPSDPVEPGDDRLFYKKGLEMFTLEEAKDMLEEQRKEEECDGDGR